MTYQIRQLKDIGGSAYAFMPYMFAETHGFDRKDYEEVYQGEIEGNDPYVVLEQIYFTFNANRPSDFHGHSLSVSDIVVLDGREYYCDNVGFVQL